MRTFAMHQSGSGWTPGVLGGLFVAAALSLALCGPPGCQAGQEASSRVCRPGPPLLAPADGRKNCLVIGDSVSLGYTPYVTALLNATCQLQHGPYSSDGGALDTKYAMQCLEQWMVTTMLQTTHYDAIVINSGLHDVNYSHGYPEEYTSPEEYKFNFQQLKKRLLAHTPHVAVVTTTPVGYDTTINDLVVQYNEIAESVMHTEAPALPVIDLYSTVTKVCGTPPYNCSIQASPKNVHYNSKGYTLLAAAVADGFKALLAARHQGHSPPPAPIKHGRHVSGKQLIEHREAEYSRGIAVGIHGAGSLLAGSTVCADGKTACPMNTTCITDHYSTTGYGCCYLSPMVDCKDSWHCCPHGTTCGQCSLHGCMCIAP